MAARGHYDAAAVPRALFIVENMSVPADPRVWPECRSLTHAGWDVAVVCPQGTEHDVDSHEEVEGVHVHRYCPRLSKGGVPGYAAEYTRALRSTRALATRLDAERSFDVVHVCNPPDVMLLALLGLRRRGAATIFDHHDLSPELFESRFGSRGLMHWATLGAERFAYNLADVVIATNESFRRVALTRGQKQPEDVFVVRNGPDPAVFRPVSPDPDLRRGKRHLIGFAGVIGPQDGVEVALDALAVLRERREDWAAVFAGSGDALDTARAHCSALDLDDVVEFLGFIHDRELLVTILSTCDIGLSPEPRSALNEQSTLIKVAEYLAVGTPVVAFDLTETRRTAGDSAQYATRDEPSALADAIEILLDDPSRRATMGARGRTRVEHSLSWANSESALLEAYERARTHPAAERRRQR
jgi:glycosyltransferase involved in cell wall biosynthesis